MPNIEITASDEPITVNLVGKPYVAHPPKTMLAIKLGKGMEGSSDPDVVFARLQEDLGLTFGPKEAAKIAKRLEDPDDLLDVGHIMQLMEKITELSTGTPTT
jgi:hypothetical protein